MKYDAIVIGGGIAGLTSAASSPRPGIRTALREENACGGSLNTFERDGFL